MNQKKLTALIALATSACSGWRMESGPLPLSERAIASTKTQALRVRLTNGTEVFWSWLAWKATASWGSIQAAGFGTAAHQNLWHEFREARSLCE